MRHELTDPLAFLLTKRRMARIGVGLLAGFATVLIGEEAALARGVGDKCGAILECPAHLECRPTPILNRCVPTEYSYEPDTRKRGQSCFDSADCSEGLACSGGTTHRMHKRKCEAEVRIDVSDLHQGDVIPCPCNVSAATGGRVVRPGDMFNALDNDQKLVAPFDVDEDFLNTFLTYIFPLAHFLPVNPFAELGQRHDGVCMCGIVEDLRGPWTGTIETEERGYETWCVGMCGEQCGEGKAGLTDSHIRYGSLIIHDVCQAFIDSRASMKNGGQYNSCGDEGHLGTADFWHSQAHQFHDCEAPGPQPAAEDAFLAPTPGTADVTASLLQSGLGSLVFTGDFDGDGHEDRFDYAPGGGAADDELTLSSDGSVYVFDIGGAYQPLIGDFDGDGDSDIFWYRSGQGGDALWLSHGDGSFAKSGRTVNGPYTPIIGDFNADGISDIYWYRPGDGADYLWLFTNTGGKVATRVDMDEGHLPLTGDLDGNGATDIFWYSTDENAPDYVWVAGLDGQFDRLTVPFELDLGVPFLTDWDDDGWDDVVFAEAPPVVLLSLGNGEFVLSGEPRYDDLMTDHE